MIHNHRLQKVRRQLADRQIDALMVSIAENRHYLSGFTAEDGNHDESAGVLLINGDHQILATDSRFVLQARLQAADWDVVCYAKGLVEDLPGLLARLAVRRLGFEAVRLSVDDHGKIAAKLAAAGSTVALVPVTDVVESLRIVKSEDEITATAKALALAEGAFQQTVQALRPGMTEKQAAWTLEMRLREAGAPCLSFPVICAAGPNAALPHAVPSDRVIQEGEPVLFDWGVKLDGYCSDTSRTLFIGERTSGLAGFTPRWSRPRRGPSPPSGPG
jgi:Xaa-Pro aminopeptidase